MTPSDSSDAVELRRLAEERLSETQKTQHSQAEAQRTAHDARRLVQELQIHQIELEIQNEQLERARAETQEALGRYTDLYEFAPAGYFSLDREGTIRQVNLTGAELLGVDRSRLVNRRFGFFVAENSRAIFRAIAEKVFASQSRETCEAMLLREGKPPFYARIEARISENGQECRAVVVDVTESKRAEAMLHKQAQLLDLAHDAIFVTDRNDCITYWNPAAQQRYGWGQEEALGKHTHTFLQTIFPRTLEEIKAILLKEGYWEGELKHATQDGSRIIVASRWSLQRDEHSNPAGFLEVNNDITEQKAVEEEIRRLNAHLEHRVSERTAQLQTANVELQIAAETKDKFLANMSHELRTPLNAIIGFAGFLVDGKPGTLNPKQKEYLEDILNSGKHLLQLIADILDLAKEGAAKMELNSERFSLRKAIAETCTVTKSVAQKKSIPINVNVAPEIGDVTLDQQKFKQVLHNLLSNAIKFNHVGGMVEIRVAMHDAHRFELVVLDNGIGIKPEDLQRLFKKFEQVESGASRRHEGTGLGLALTRKIVELQGGTIGVESEFGKGSRFTVVLPLVAAEAEQRGHLEKDAELTPEPEETEAASLRK
jgi:PAS domain S-box-containing protein